MRKLCECGCAQPTAMASITNRKRGWVKGEPLRFLHGHNRVSPGFTSNDYDVVDRGYQSPCWVWRRKLNTNGYGRVTVDRKVLLAHRATYQALIGPISDDLELDHLCRVRSCVNPWHLEAITHAKNVQRGSARKLTETQIEAMKQWRRAGKALREIAREFGVVHSTVSRLTQGTDTSHPAGP